jgi:predicted methyltransferase
MNEFRLSLFPAVLALTTLAIAFAYADDDSVAARVEAQMQMEDRHVYDAPKDAGRKPVESFEFMGVETGMTILDAGSGAGYSAELLSAAVGPDGLVYAQSHERATRLQDGYFHNTMMSRFAEGRLRNVAYLIQDFDDISLTEEVDLVHWGFNLHDYYNRAGKEAVVQILNNFHRALKSDGILIVSDHVGLEGRDNAAIHRITIDDLTEVITLAGFDVVAVSDLLRNPDDDHTLGVFDDAIYRQTDRVIVRAVKR